MKFNGADLTDRTKNAIHLIAMDHFKNNRTLFASTATHKQLVQHYFFCFSFDSKLSGEIRTDFRFKNYSAFIVKFNGNQSRK